MHIKTTKLDNGLRIITAELSGFDTAYVGAYVNAGSRNEEIEENGIAHFLEHMAFKGTTTRTALQISSEIEDLGSNFNAYTSQNITAYHVSGLGSNINKAVEIIGDLVINSTFNSEELEIERGVILQEISRSNDDPTRVAYNLYGGLAYPDQALGRATLGPPDNIRGFDRQNFLSFVDRFYTSRNTVVVASGNVRHDELVDMVAEAFSGMPEGSFATPYPAQWGGGYAHTTEAKFEQVTALIGWKSVSSTHEDVFAHRMLASALGGASSSPIFQEVREKRGLVYAVSSYHDDGPDYGELALYAGTTPDNIDQVVKVSCNVLLEAASQISDRDFLRARNQELVTYASIKERPARLAGYLADSILTYGEIISPEQKKAEIEAITKEDLVKAAQTIFSSTPTVAMVGPVPETNYLAMVQAEMGN